MPKRYKPRHNFFCVLTRSAVRSTIDLGPHANSVTQTMTTNKLPTDEKRISPDPIVDASEWLDEHGDALYRYARSRVGRRELAEDLVQETFLAAVESREPFRSESTVRTWLIAILRRKIVDHYRRRSAAPDCESLSIRSSPDHASFFTADGKWQKVPSPWKTPPDMLENRELWTAFSACLSKLPMPLARTFMLRELVGVDVDELRETLSMSAVNVRVQLHRARHLLRECLERNWFGEDLHKRTRSS